MSSNLNISPAMRTLLLFSFALPLSLCIVASTGCYQRTLSPELTYDQSQVDTLDREIKKLDWEK